ncbi:hypothetical protein CJU89_4875 [Yarrowia sp. B02]|nr:hypothetical protein CJU89_4875 [Yarrowia sp. B02]
MEVHKQNLLSLEPRRQELKKLNTTSHALHLEEARREKLTEKDKSDLIEDILKSKVIQRSPWMKPQAEMRSWADCALVFVKRIQSSKWTLVDHFRDISKKRKDSPVKDLLAVELKKGEKLPENFQSFRDTRPSSSEGEIVVAYGGFEITLPMQRPENVREIEVGENVLLVKFDADRYISPRDKLHYKHASVYHYAGGGFDVSVLEGGFLMDDVFVVGKAPEFKHGKKRKRVEKDRGFTFKFFNTYSKKFIRCTPDSFAEAFANPVACYNGLIWWFMNDRDFVPTFLDRLSGKLYVRKDWIMTATNIYHPTDVQEELFVSKVTLPVFTGSRPISVEGFSHGKFNALYMSEETEEYYEEQDCWPPRQKKVSDDDIFFDA